MMNIMVVNIIKGNTIEQIGNGRRKIRRINKLLNFTVAHNKVSVDTN